MASVETCVNPTDIYYNKHEGTHYLYVKCDASEDPKFDLEKGLAIYFVAKKQTILIQGIEYSSTDDAPSIFILHDINEIDKPLVTSSILFIHPGESQSGKLEGGKVTYTCQPDPIGDTLCNIRIDPYNAISATSSSSNLKLGIANKFHLAIIGVDDIRASVNSSSSYVQLYPLEKQILFLKLDNTDVVPEGAKILNVQYKKY